ncbi:hypothetical protein Efla_005650 [Eimeria flavescens]
MHTLKILPLRAEAQELYTGHGTFHEGDSGLDLFIMEECTISPGETKMLRLGFCASMCNAEDNPVSWLILPRSSISRTPLRLANSVGLIDAGYRGELMAAVDNIKQEPFTLVEGLDRTSRGEGGYGSTGN